MKRYKKPYRVKRKKSIFRNRFFWLAILIFAAIGGIFYFVVFSSTFQIKEIKISGNQKILIEDLQNLIQSQIKQKVLFFSSDSIFLANLNKISEKILEKFPQIDKINFKRKFPNTLEILIEEKKPVAIFCQNELCFFVDKEGIIFEQTDQKRGFPKIIGEQNIEPLTLEKKIVEKDYLEAILEFQRELDENLKIDVKEFIIGKEKLTTITLEDWQIYFNLRENISEQILNLDLVLKEKISPENRGNLQYIDLRFGNRVYFKYK